MLLTKLICRPGGPRPARRGGGARGGGGAGGALHSGQRGGDLEDARHLGLVVLLRRVRLHVQLAAFAADAVAHTVHHTRLSIADCAPRRARIARAS